MLRLRFVRVDLNRRGAPLPGQSNQGRCRLDNRRRADTEEKIARERGALRESPLSLRQTLTKPDYTGTDSPATVTAARWLDFPPALRFIWNSRRQNMRTATGVANGMMQRAVKMMNFIATGALMQVIDILGAEKEAVAEAFFQFS